MFEVFFFSRGRIAWGCHRSTVCRVLDGFKRFISTAGCKRRGWLASASASAGKCLTGEAGETKGADFDGCSELGGEKLANLNQADTRDYPDSLDDLDPDMTSNYDPRPGRWMLPLVILAMVAFTYLFVRELPSAASASTTTEEGTGLTGSPTTATSTPGVTTTGPVVIDPAAQEYIDSLGGFQTRLVDLQGQLGAANTAWDADPRTITFDQAEAEFSAVAQAAAALVGELQALVPPESLTDAHTSAVAAAQQAADAANAALAGLRAPAPDTGEGRRTAVVNFDAAVTAFAEAVSAATEAASAG